MKDHAQTLASSLPQQITPEIRSGESLVGDDYSAAQIAQWFAQEKEAFFADDDGNSLVDPFYAYMRSLTMRLGAAALRSSGGATRSMLVLGPGNGVEVENFLAADPSWRLTFVEASDNFRRELARRFPTSTVVPAAESGVLPVESATIDLTLTLSVLHHIPNVSWVLRELGRVLRPGGHAIVREPCSSMGDWRFPRSATPNERGISKRWLLQAAARAGLTLAQEPIPVLFHPLSIAVKKFRAVRLMRTPIYRFLDLAVSRLVQFNDRYWRDSWHHKLAPSAYFYLFRNGSPGTRRS